MTKTLFFEIGLPASGKSTWAKCKIAEDYPNGDIVYANKDVIRKEILGADGKWSKEVESQVVAKEIEIVEDGMNAGFDVIVDNTHFLEAHETRYRELAKKHGYVFNIVDFRHVPLEECIRRDNARANGVGEAVIRRMWRQYLRPTFKTYTPPETGDIVVICDLDGTLSLPVGRQWWDTARSESDHVRSHVLITLYALFSIGVVKKIIFVTGREERFRDITTRFLNTAANIKQDFELFMRPDGDEREDEIIKWEIFERHIRQQYRVFAVFDDRPRVIRMWQFLGLPVFSVNRDYDDDY